jgi:Leucine-rich repeat (LRR) protein
LTKLKTLNISDNQIIKLPANLGNLTKLKTLLLHNNLFHGFPTSFKDLKDIQEISLEWFMYAKPSKDKLIKRNVGRGEKLLNSLFKLCELLLKY